MATPITTPDPSTWVEYDPKADPKWKGGPASEVKIGTMEKGPGYVVRGLEDVGKGIAFGAGGLVGEAMGGGPLTPTGLAEGAVMAGTAATAYDAVVAKANDYVYGTNTANLSAENVQSDLRMNTLADMGGRLLQPVVGGSIVGGTGLSEVAEAGKVARTEAMEGAAEKALPEMRSAAIEQATGRSAAESAASVHAPGEVSEYGATRPSAELTRRRVELRDIVKGSLNKVQADYGKEYEALRGEHLEDPVPGGPLAEAAAEQRVFAQQNNYKLSARTRALLDDADNTAKPAMRKSGKPKGDAPLMTKRGPRYVSPPSGTAPLEPTAAQILSFRSRAFAAAADANTGYESKIAREMGERAQKMLADAKIPGTPELNSQYETWKLLTDKIYDELHTAEPTDAMPAVFNNKDLGPIIINNASPADRALLRKHYADAAFADPDGFIKPAEQADSLAALLKDEPNNKLRDPKSFVNLGKKFGTATEVLDAHPELLAQIRAKVERAGQEAAYKSIRSGETAPTKGILGQMWNRYKNRMAIFLPIAVGGAATGRAPSAVVAGSLVLGSAGLARDAVQKAWTTLFEHSPRMAAALAAHIDDPKSAAFISLFSRGIADSITYNLMEDIPGAQKIFPQPPLPTVNSVATKPAVREGTDVRTGKPGDSHAEIEDRMPPGKGKEHGFVGADGKFMKRTDARDAIKGLGGDPASHGPHSDELAVNANLPPNPPTPITLGNSPMQEFATQALAKAVPPQKAALYRDYDEAARAYRKGDVAALEPREWQRKGMTPQEPADGWRRSKMGRVEAGLSMLPLDQVAQAWQLASDKNDKGDAAAAARVVKQKVAEVGWQNIPQQAKAVIAPLIRRMLVPEKEEANA